MNVQAGFFFSVSIFLSFGCIDDLSICTDFKIKFFRIESSIIPQNFVKFDYQAFCYTIRSEFFRPLSESFKADSV